jgi:hypothetical protein
MDCGRHGQRVKYANTQNYFCRCFSGWFGYFCNINHQCQCSRDSICAGVIMNRSICICPLHKFSTFCYLIQYLCQSDTCNYRGICIPDDERISSQCFTCLCNEDYSEPRCEFMNTEIDISFHYVSISPAIFAHFIVAIDSAPHVRTTIFTKIAFDKDTVTLFRSTHFTSYCRIFGELLSDRGSRKMRRISYNFNTCSSFTSLCTHISFV